MGAGLRKSSSCLYCAGSRRTGNAGRNRLKRNRVSPQTGRAELGDPGRAPNTQATVPAPPRPAGRAGGLRPDPCLGRPLLPGPGTRSSQATGAPRWPWGDAAPPPVQTAQISRLAGPPPPKHAVSNLLGLRRSPQLRSRLPRAPRGPWRGGWEGGGAGICFRLPVWARGQEPRFLRVQTPRAPVSRLDARAGPPPAVPGSRGDGRPLTRGAEAARRGLDHWAAEGAARREGPAQPGPLICLYYPRETKLPGTDAQAPSCLRKPQHTLTSVPPTRGPQMRRTPSLGLQRHGPKPQSESTPAGFSRRPGPARAARGGLGWEVLDMNCWSGERKWSKRRKTRGRRAG